VYAVPTKTITLNPALPPGIERRGHPRLPLDLLCQLGIPGPKPWKASGRTLNISRSGVLVKLDSLLAAPAAPVLGAALRVDIELPTKRYLRCHGRVVRVQASADEGPTLAVAVKRMEFRQSLRKPAMAVRNGNWRQVKEMLM
jgi:hypothetical protein